MVKIETFGGYFTGATNINFTISFAFKNTCALGVWDSIVKQAYMHLCQILGSWNLPERGYPLFFFYKGLNLALEIKFFQTDFTTKVYRSKVVYNHFLSISCLYFFVVRCIFKKLHNCKFMSNSQNLWNWRKWNFGFCYIFRLR